MDSHEKLTLITMQLKTPGGIERFVCTLAKMFSENHEVEIVVNYGKKTDPLAFELPNNIKLTFLSPTQPAEVSMKSLVKNRKWQKIPAELKRRHNINKEQNRVFKTYLENLKTDYIITERAKYNSLVGKFYKGSAKKIATDHNFHQYQKKYINELKKSLKGFDALVVATKELQKFYSTHFKNIKTYFIPNPLPNIPTKKSTLTSKNLVAVGRFVPEKDFLTLIEVMNLAVKSDPEIKLTLIGDGPEMPLIKQKIKNLHLDESITLTGFLPQAQIEKYYYDSSLFILTSVTEAFALVITEAMSYGLPVIAFDRASGARAHINKNTGILIQNSDTQAMASAIVKLLNDRQSLKDYQNHINKTIQQYSLKENAKLWSQIVK